MAVSSDEVNYLVSRYLRESGFSHTAFVFETESMVNSSNLVNTKLPPGALVSILQKSLRGMKIEKAIKIGKKDPNDPINEEIKQLEEEYSEKPPPSKKAIVDERITKKDEIKNEQGAFSDQTQLLQNYSKQQGNGRLPTVFISQNSNDSLRRKIIQLSPENATLLKGHNFDAYCCHWSPDGSFLVTGGDNGVAFLREMKEDVQVSQTQLSYSFSGPQDIDRDITSVDISHDGNLIAIASFDHLVRVFSRKGDLLAVLQGHSDRVYCIRFNPSGNLLVSCSKEQSAIIWETEKFTRVATLTGHTETVVDLAWQCDTTFATASADCRVGVWSVEKGVGKFLLQGHTKQVTGVSWNSDSTLLASSSDDETVRVWNEAGQLAILEGHTGSVNGVRWHPKRPNILCSYGADSSIVIWDIQLREKVTSITKHSGGIISLDFDPTGQFLASGDAFGKIVVTRMSDFTTVGEYIGIDSVHEIKWSPNGKLICACLAKGPVWVIRIL